jgi:hypothetical protein
MDSKWSTDVTTLKICMARVAFLEKFDQKVGFCTYPISIRSAKVMYNSSNLTGSLCHSGFKRKQHSPRFHLLIVLKICFGDDHFNKFKCRKQLKVLHTHFWLHFMVQIYI